MQFDIALPGNNHIPGTPEWTWTLTSADWKRILGVVDGLGLASVTTSEHFAMPYETVPRLGPYWQHALSVMAFLAGATDHLRIDATVLVLPYHHPLALAKALSTIDHLSGGRLNVSVGVGHAETEFKVLGTPFAERGAVSDEILDKCVPIAGTPDECIEAVERYRDAGCTHIMLELWGDERLRQIELFGKEVLPRFR